MPLGASYTDRSGGACHRALFMPIEALIIDDEQPARDELAFLLGDYSDIHIAGQAANGVEGFDLIKSESPDLIFLDVQMPGLDGFGLIRKLLDSKIPLPQVVFATAFDQYAVQAFEVNAVDYILKPVDKVRLGEAVERVRKTLQTSDDSAGRLATLLTRLEEGQSGAAGTTGISSKLTLQSQGRLLVIDCHEMVFAAIEDGVITIHTRDAEGASSYNTIDELQQHLGGENFWRPHRSYLVNINQIKEVMPWFKSSYQLRMRDRRGSEIPVSRNQMPRLRQLFKL